MNQQQLGSLVGCVQGQLSATCQRVWDVPCHHAETCSRTIGGVDPLRKAQGKTWGLWFRDQEGISAMSVRARSAIIAAMDGAVLALAIIAAGMLVLWWVFSPE
jgi:hypothetical protein